MNYYRARDDYRRLAMCGLAKTQLRRHYCSARGRKRASTSVNKGAHDSFLEISRLRSRRDENVMRGVSKLITVGTEETASPSSFLRS